MEFLNIGGGELLVIVLLALVLFRPEDMYKAMRTLGRYTRSARSMWNEFSVSLKREMEAQEVEDALKETKGLMSSAQDALDTLQTSVSDVKKTVEADVAEAGQSLKSQAAQSAAAVTAEAAPAVTKGAAAPEISVEAIAAAVTAASAAAGSPDASAEEDAAHDGPVDDQPAAEPELAEEPDNVSGADVSGADVSEAPVPVDLPEAVPADVEPMTDAAPVAEPSGEAPDAAKPDTSDAEVQVPEAVVTPHRSAPEDQPIEAGGDAVQATDMGEVSQPLAEVGTGESTETLSEAPVPADLPEAVPVDVGVQPETAPAHLSSESREES